MLDLLNEVGEETSAATEAMPPVEPSSAGERQRLRHWPLGFESWPAAWIRVLAALSGSALDARELAERCDIAPAEVSRCLNALRALDALDRPEAARPAPAADSGWRLIFHLVGRKLGFRT